MSRGTKLVVSAVAVMGVAGAVLAAITGTAHDFSDGSGFQNDNWNGTGEKCAPCHTPHNGSMAYRADGAPLWDHEVTTNSFTPYQDLSDGSPTMDADDVGSPSGISLLCLSCHDGVVALDSFGGVTGSTNITGSALLDSDLSDDHPISFTYNDTLAGSDNELHTPSTDNSGLGGTIAADMLFGGKVECASCHDPHGGVASTALLIKSNADSGLCLTCHDK